MRWRIEAKSSEGECWKVRWKRGVKLKKEVMGRSEFRGIIRSYNLYEL